MDMKVSDKVEIVLAQVAELKDVILMCKEMVPESTFAHCGFDMHHFGNYCYNLLEMENAAVFVAKVNGEIVGALLCSIWPGITSPSLVAMEHGFYVRPERRSLRVARLLLSTYVEWAKKRGAVRVDVNNSAGAPDEGFQKLLNRCGFAKSGSQMYMNV